MLEKIKAMPKNDELFLQKIGVFIGGTLGFVLGLIVSDRADRFEQHQLKQEAINVEEKN